MKRTLYGLFVVALIGMTALVPLANPQNPLDSTDDSYTIALNVDLVLFNVGVTDSRGNHVSGLTASDFQVREGGRLQDISLFHPEDASATVGLIMDNSGSMMKKRTDVLNAALSFVNASNRRDEMFVVNFNERVLSGLPKDMLFTNDPSRIRTALARMVTTGKTALYDALAMGFDHLNAGTKDRKALVVISDGGDNASKHSLNQILEIAKRSTATVYAIGIYASDDSDRNPRALRRIAESTGGAAYFPDDLQKLDKVSKDIADGIRGQYTIGYISTNRARDGKFRKVTITANGPTQKSLRIRTRDGYIAMAK